LKKSRSKEEAQQRSHSQFINPYSEKPTTMPSLKITTWPFAVLGAILSLYALYVEHKISHKSPVEEEGVEEFSALCDIESIGASCR